jgi:homoprotocatechuate degradation regulator HpaR
MDRDTSIPDFSYSLPMLLMRGRESVMRFFRPSLRAHDVTEQQWRVLRALSYFGDCEITELARITFLHAPSLTRILRDMQTRGLVHRIANAQDRRRGIVSITDHGWNLITAVMPGSESGYEQIKECFGAERLKSLQKLLLELEASLAQAEATAEDETEDEKE